jgi:short-subunit dehydrogenase
MCKTIFITGASSGIGEKTAKLFVEKGWNVVATMRNMDKDSALRQYSENITILPLDVTDEQSIKNAVQMALDKFEKIDVLLNNAGYGAIGALEAANYNDYFKQFDTNLFGTIRVIQAVLPSMRKNKGGIIINISSVAEIVGSPFGSLYHSSKWALSGLSESLQYELSDFNIRVKLILPPPVKTNFWGRSMVVLNNGTTSVYDNALNKSFWLNNHLLEKVAIPPKDIAKIIFRAATDGRKKMRYKTKTGSMIRFFRRILPDSIMFWFVKRITR